MLFITLFSQLLISSSVIWITNRSGTYCCCW